MKSFNIKCDWKGWEKMYAHTCSIASGVEIMPPHRVTRARERQEAHRTTSSCSIWSAMALIWGLLMRIALMKSWQWTRSTHQKTCTGIWEQNLRGSMFLPVTKLGRNSGGVWMTENDWQIEMKILKQNNKWIYMLPGNKQKEINKDKT